MTEQDNPVRQKEISFRQIPDDVEPGKPYLTIGDLVSTGLTKYTPQQIGQLAKNGILSAFQIGRLWYLWPEAISQIHDYENDESIRRFGASIPGRRK